MEKLTLLLTFSLFTVFAFTQNLPEIFSSIQVKMKDGHSPPEMTNYIKDLNRGLDKFGRGVQFWMSYGDRGERKQQLVYGFAFDFKANRDYYFPIPDDNSDSGNPQFQALAQKMANAGYSVNQNIVDEDPYTDWVCVGFDQLVDPQLGGLVAVRSLPLKSGVEMDFEKFVTSELYPAFSKNMEGLDAYVYKGDRGAGKGSYIFLWSFDTVQRRNSYFPTEDGDPSEAFNKAYEDVSTVMEKLNSFISDEATSVPFTDYVRVDVSQ